MSTTTPQAEMFRLGDAFASSARRDWLDDVTRAAYTMLQERGLSSQMSNLATLRYRTDAPRLRELAELLYGSTDPSTPDPTRVEIIERAFFPARSGWTRHDLDGPDDDETLPAAFFFTHDDGGIGLALAPGDERDHERDGTIHARIDFPVAWRLGLDALVFNADDPVQLGHLLGWCRYSVMAYSPRLQELQQWVPPLVTRTLAHDAVLPAPARFVLEVTDSPVRPWLPQP